MCGASVSGCPCAGRAAAQREPEGRTTPPRDTMAGAPRREAVCSTTGPLAPSLVDQVVEHVVVVGHVAET
eukprot:3412358-Prymnesium_polylepis.1